MTKPLSQDKRKGKGNRVSEAEYKIDKLFRAAESAAGAGNLVEAKQNFVEALECVQEFPDPNMAILLETVFCTRIATVSERQGDNEDAVKYYIRAVELYEIRGIESLSPPEVKEYGVLAEKAAQLAMSTYNDSEKVIKPLTLLLHYAEATHKETDILMGSHILGKFKAAQQKFEEAIQYFEKAIAVKITSQPDLTLPSMAALFQLNHKLGRHEANKKLLPEFVEFATEHLPPQKAAHSVGSVTEQMFDYGYYEECLIYFKRAVALFQRQNAREEVLHYENALAQTMVELGSLREAREKLKALIPTIGDLPVPLTFSKYLKTDDVFFSPENGNVVLNLKMSVRESGNLPAGTLLVCKVQKPFEEQPEVESELLLGEDSSVLFKVQLPRATKGYYIVQVDIYMNATRTNRLSSHLVLSQCDLEAPALA
jgi:tetratricopeptide (TPR) repeat protein